MSLPPEDAVREMLDRLNLVDALAAEHAMLAALANHEIEITDQGDLDDLRNWEAWPSWVDDDVVALGPPRGRDESFDPEPDDFAMLDDLIERAELERDCRWRFA